LARVSCFVLICGLALLGPLGCTLLPVHRSTAPVHFAQAPSPHGEDRFPNWPLPPDTAASLMLEAPREIRSAEGAGGGTTGAEKLKVHFFKDDVTLTVKWKEMPPGKLDGINNAPRKELAAYAVQRLFMAPEDYVVPTSVAHCAPLDDYRAHHPEATATLEGTSCVLGVASVWMKDVTVPDVLFDDARFRADANYAYFMANLNLLTYLAAHHDGREGNFLVSKDETRRQVFAVDNGLSFGGVFYNWSVANWNSIRVPALRKESVDKLRQLKRRDLDGLGVVAQLELDERGINQKAKLGENLDPKKGVRIQGGVVQLGLTESEIDDVYQRIQHLIRDVDAGKLQTF
jgi:hypothetical protein